MIGRAVQWTWTPSATPLQPKKLNAHFWIMFNFWWSAGLVNGLKPHLPALSRQRNKMLVFGLCSNFWWSAGLVSGLVPPLPPLSSQKNKILVFGLCSTSDDWPCWSIDLNPVCLPSPVKKMKCLFLDYVQFLMISQAVQWTWTHLPPLSSQKNKILVFGLRSTSDDQPGWLMYSNPICHPSPAKKIKFLFFDYVQLFMIGRAVQWTRTPSATPLQPKK